MFTYTLCIVIPAFYLLEATLYTTGVVTTIRNSNIYPTLIPTPKCERGGKLYSVGEIYSQCTEKCLCEEHGWQCLYSECPPCGYELVHGPVECCGRCPDPIPPTIKPQQPGYCGHLREGEKFIADILTTCICENVNDGPYLNCTSRPGCVLPDGRLIPKGSLFPFDPYTNCRCLNASIYHCITHSCKAPGGTPIVPGSSYSPFPYTTCYCNQTDPSSNATMSCVVNPVPTTAIPVPLVPKLNVSPPVVGKRRMYLEEDIKTQKNRYIETD